MPNALPEPAELRGHLIIARCGVGAPRTSPRLGGKTQPAAHQLLRRRDGNNREQSGLQKAGSASERKADSGE